jgi:hypothetical protein
MVRIYEFFYFLAENGPGVGAIFVEFESIDQAIQAKKVSFF